MPRPAPWDEVIDIQGGLFKWLADRKKIKVEAGKPKDEPLAVVFRSWALTPTTNARAPCCEDAA